MRTDVKLSTKFLTTQNAHQVGVLVTLTGEVPVRRAPLNIALVLDRSGSMSGMPLIAAKEAAKRFAGFLGPQDRLSIVTFDGEVRTAFGPAPAGDPMAIEAIERIQAGGSTNLSGGWLEGLAHLKAGLVDGVNRVVLLTDGQANAGIVEPQTLAGMTGGAVRERISTTCIGFGAHFNEDLLQLMAKSGGANYWYVENHDQMMGIFEEEIEGLVALAAQNVKVEVTLTHPKAMGVSFLQDYPVEATPDNRWRASLGDCYATSPLALGLIFHVEDVAALGEVQVAQVRTEADVIRPDGIEHLVTVLPVMANLDGTDHPEATVERTFLRFEAAKVREEAVRRADGGDFDGAARALRSVSEVMRPHAAYDGVLREEVADLDREAARLAAHEYSAADRKYHRVRSSSAR
ncbi:MAG TPA: VWA domain-containing protein, partial [Gemmatimonadales bacterium]|nr:VWA domain-containing protein [Gemmatimonadales bacterium]